ncbi:MAG: hypothetical protein JXR56_04760, partial [Candidatus Cloacimonetes bacterium]|nr:hypothetical protein [Candidatus Cloacimonadota bacterium]
RNLRLRHKQDACATDSISIESFNCSHKRSLRTAIILIASYSTQQKGATENRWVLLQTPSGSPQSPIATQAGCLCYEFNSLSC